MCRLLGYLGSPLALERLLYQPEHSLVVQSYQPREMTAGLMNADGFGVGWYRDRPQLEAFSYRSVLPIWNDVNLPGLSRYVESRCVLACVRSATPGLGLDISNCQPFQQENILGVHNGFIQNFRQTLYRPIRDRLHDSLYQAIQGTTDSEHLFALVLHEWQNQPDLGLGKALHHALEQLSAWTKADKVTVSANLIMSDGEQLVACRFAANTAAPSLYYLSDDPQLPQAVLIASEPLFPGNWQPCPENSILNVGADLDLHLWQR